MVHGDNELPLPFALVILTVNVVPMKLEIYPSKKIVGSVLYIILIYSPTANATAAAVRFVMNIFEPVPIEFGVFEVNPEYPNPRDP